jgi:hypothetical protein
MTLVKALKIEARDNVAAKYPWYEVIEDGELEQGDLLKECPVIAPVLDMSFPLSDDAIPVDILTFDVVVMTQSCDLVNDKVKEVILCPH